MSKFDAKKVMPRYRAISFGHFLCRISSRQVTIYHDCQARLLDEGSQQTEERLGDR